MRARYTFRKVGGAIFIIDLCLPDTCSVTNDVEWVVADIAQFIPDVASHRILYRDTTGRWDGIRVGPDLQFLGFIGVGARTALRALRQTQMGRMDR